MAAPAVSVGLATEARTALKVVAPTSAADTVPVWKSALAMEMRLLLSASAMLDGAIRTAARKAAHCVFTVAARMRSVFASLDGPMTIALLVSAQSRVKTVKVNARMVYALAILVGLVFNARFLPQSARMAALVKALAPKMAVFASPSLVAKIAPRSVQIIAIIVALA
jgi:hypothetical protein